MSGNEQPSNSSKTANALSALALLVTALSFGLALHVQNQVERLEIQQYASKVYIGEPPKYAYDRHQHGEETLYVVMNASETQIESVWVDGTKNDGGLQVDSTMLIQGIPRCSMYALPEGFDPSGVHFQDSYGHWVRPFGDVPSESDDQMPDGYDESLESPWWEDVEGC